MKKNHKCSTYLTWGGLPSQETHSGRGQVTSTARSFPVSFSFVVVLTRRSHSELLLHTYPLFFLLFVPLFPHFKPAFTALSPAGTWRLTGACAEPGRAQAYDGRHRLSSRAETRGRRDVGVQSDLQWCDVAVQVDLIGLSCRTPGSDDVPWRCLAVRPEPTEGGALWHCCLHSNSTLAPPSSAALLGPSPSRTPELQTTYPACTSLPAKSSSPQRCSLLRP
ncbi:hypothetical protein WMY93_029601 [Mugilogobius chulae]|uniref:Uncharacterized protein n=1 Tax=Mugilogobius chulae TaxID=88201 RepID=A0AAW0MKB2_9GOBI